MKSFFKYWVPVVIWVAIIFIGSTDLMSVAQTSRIIGPILRWFNPDISGEAIAHIQFIVRKSAHLTEYAILAALLWRALRGSVMAMRMSILGSIVFIASAVFAASDEFHQLFVSSRTASPIDVVIDVCGALGGLVICWRFAAAQNEHQR